MTAAYIGDELEIFAHASQWKAYFSSLLPPLGKGVLEVGAGLGATTASLCDGSQREWICLEPDGRLLSQIESKIRTGGLPACCRPFPGTVQDLDPQARYDTILYIDVLEHIEADRDELDRAVRHLAPGGHLAVLAPAYEFLASPFDRAIGHFRRYSRASLAALTPPGCKCSRVAYLDSVGLLTSLANRLLLRQNLPTRAQILFWDRRLIPLSRWIDRLVGYHFGRSILFVWTRLKEPA